MQPPDSRTIDVDYLARVEGEGALRLRVEGDVITEVEFRIFEPPRYFEAFLVDRHFSEAPDITARICGICPVAYQMSATHALEAVGGVVTPEGIRELRRLLYCGEWMESHALHVFFLHAPDFLGFQDAIAMAEQHPEAVRNGLRLKKIGNRILEVLGGRAVHPINVKVGGFFRVPTADELAPLGAELEWARQAALDTVAWAGALEFPDFSRDYEFVSLRHPSEYPFNEGRIISNRGLDISVEQWPEYFSEEHVARSNALHARTRAGSSYFVGPLARYANCFDLLPDVAKEAAERAALGPVVRNPFQSIVVRAVELVFACDEALRIIGGYRPPTEPAVAVPMPGGVGHGATEAPRGLLYHRYVVGSDELIDEAHIVPPTSQNQLSIEEDLLGYAQPRLGLSDDRLQWELEQAIRNYDPCISCATHFLDLRIERS